MRPVSPALVKRTATAVHRWLGVALCVLFLLWFPSGIGMMYWSFPGVTTEDRLDRSPALDPSTIVVSAAEAHARSGSREPLTRARLGMFDRRPVYRFGVGGGERVVYADTGEPRREVARAALARVASAWTGQPQAAAVVEEIDVDQWTVEGPYRSLTPLWKYSWPDGEQVYVSQKTGDVEQYTTTGLRVAAYLGPIPHWLYFTPLRRRPVWWRAVVISASGAAAFSAVLGILIGLSTYSPTRRYRAAGAPAALPFRGAKRWHVVVGLLVGVGAATWAFSGMLSMDPFPAARGPRIPESLHGQCDLRAIEGRGFRAALTTVADLGVKELECTSFGGEPLYLATLSAGATRIVPIAGPPRTEFDRERITDLVARASAPSGIAEVRTLDQYDRYYLDRRQRRPLPVILVRLNDADATRYYIDPRTARVVGAYSSRQWATRWLYHGLHSLDFPWLYRARPAWDLVVLAFMIGGTALSLTGAILAWRVVKGRLA